MSAPERASHQALLQALLITGVLLGSRAAEAQEGMGSPTGSVQQQLATSVHQGLSCASCHGRGHAIPGSAAGSCQGCHQEAATHVRRGPHGVALMRGVQETPTCVSCHGSHRVRHIRDPVAPTWAGHVSALCGRCHQQAQGEFATSVHGRALMTGQMPTAPTCATCHSAHAAMPVPRARVAESCGACHIEAQLAFTRSVHGTAVRRGVLHAPTCTGCHGIHAVPAAAEPASPTTRLRVAQETCARCHGSVQITQMHALPIQVVEDFRGSFHGLAAAAGDRRVAHCASCHGYHEIRPASSPLSAVHPANLGQTCGQCHPGAGARFAQGGVHHSATTWGHRLVDWVQSMYSGMIVVVIGLMAVHNGLDWQRRWRDRRHREPLAAPEAAVEYVRFTVHERLQHWTAAASFLTLAWTGFALRFGWRLPWLPGDMQQATRATIHRGAAVIFMGVAVYHLGYLLLSRRGREMARSILPRIRGFIDLACCGGACMRLGPPSVSDWRELLGTVKYNLGLANVRPAYGRFAYWEKMEYWALVWGTVVMVITGLVLWFETPFLNRFPYWALELCRIVHLYEAILAALAILVWHFYATMLNPDVFPLNRAMTRGTLTHEEMLRDHPREINTTTEEQADDVT